MPRNTFEIEDIEAMRLQEGIDDVELRAAVRGLRCGDLVNLTLRIGEKSFAARVRIKRKRRSAFGGELAARLVGAGRSGLPVGSALTFTAAHIHSIVKGPGAVEP
jgi:hypothetical protein